MPCTQLNNNTYSTCTVQLVVVLSYKSVPQAAPCSVIETSVSVSLRVYFGLMTSHGEVGRPKTTGTNVGGHPSVYSLRWGAQAVLYRGPLRRSHLRPLRRGES